MYRGGAKPEVQARLDWNGEGIPLMPPLVHEVEAGIDRVIALIKTDRLFFFDDLDGLIDEFGTYSREVDEFGEVKEAIKDKDEFHRLDSLRYIAQALGTTEFGYRDSLWES